MSFFYRVFTTVEKNIWADEIDAFLSESGLGLSLIGVVEEEDESDLEATPVQLIVMDGQDREVASLVYDRLEESDILPEELDEFQSLVDEMAPECNRAWAHEQLRKTIGCYAFQILQAGFEPENWDAIATLAGWLRAETSGIEQSDGGQITNENGAVVLAVPDDEDDDEEDYEDEDEFEEIDSDDEEFDEDDSDDDEELGDEEFGDEDEDYDDEWENFVAAIRVGNEWVEKEICSEEELQEFLGGDA